MTAVNVALAVLVVLSAVNARANGESWLSLAGYAVVAVGLGVGAWLLVVRL